MGVCNPACGTTTTNGGFGGSTFGQTDIDAGLAAVSSQSGKFEAIRTTSMMAHSSYFLPDNGKTWIAGGYGTIYSSWGRMISSFKTVDLQLVEPVINRALEHLALRRQVAGIAKG